MLPRSSRPRAAWGTGVYPSKQYFDIKMRCLRQRRHRRRWYLKGADNTPYEKIGDEVRSLADEVPFEIPDSWEWVRLIDVCEYIQRGKSPKYSPIKKYPVVAQKCNQWSGFSIEKAQFIEPNSLSSYGPERLLQDNDLMWNSTGLGTLGRMAIYKTAANPYELAVADSHVTVIRPLKQFVLPEYLYYYFANPSVQSVIEDQADGTTKQKELATATIKAYLTPIPPLDEQRRILAKLSEVLPVVKNYGVVYDETTAMQEAFPESLKKSVLQESWYRKTHPTSLQRLCWSVSGRRSSGSSRKAKSKRTSTNLSFSDGIILIMRSWTVWSAVSTMNYPLRSRNRGRGCAGGQSQNLFNTGIMHRPNRKDASEWFA